MRREGPSKEGPAVTVERLLLRLTMMDLKQTAAHLRGYGLTLPQFFALLAIERGGSAGATMTEVAEGTLQSPSSLTGIVGRLEGRGLCRRKRDRQDRRVVRACLTDEGRELLASIREARRAELAHALEDVAVEEMLPHLRELLDALAYLAFPNGDYPPGLIL